MTQKLDNVPTVSIGMPVYNGGYFIRQALDSLLTQTFTDFELIISDNASIDETEITCREYAAKDNRVRYVRQTKNRGATENFQFVLDEAIGEYFMWAAADDIWDPDFIAKNYLALKSEPYVVASISKVRMATIEHKSPIIVGTYPLTGSFLSKLRKYISRTGANSRFYSIYDTKVIKKCFFPGKFIGSDFCTIINVLRYGDFYEVDEVLMERSSYGGSSRLLTEQIKAHGIKNFEKFIPLLKFTTWLSTNLEFHLFFACIDCIAKINIFYFLVVVSELFKIRKPKPFSASWSAETPNSSCSREK